MNSDLERASLAWIAASGLLALGLACSSELGSRAGNGDGAGTSTVAPPSTPSSGSNDLGNSGQASPTLGSGPLFESGSGAIPPRASSEICDGVDNDTNGVVDDVDVGGDGVCDCLNIATIGEIGPWGGSGNLFATWLDQRSPMGATALGNQVLTDDLLRPFQVIFVLYAATSRLDANGRALQPHHEFSAEEVAVFQRWIEAGGA